MAEEKILLESLVSKLSHIPGGITVYDSSSSAKKLSKPTSLTDLQAQGIKSLSKTELEKQGIFVKEGLSYGYPTMKQSLVSFQGTLNPYTLIFTNPSEDPKKHSEELKTQVFQTEVPIEFGQVEPVTIPVRRLHDGQTTEISRLGHLIALPSLQKPQSSFPPTDLRLYLPPVHIPSQHIGDCAADTMQTALFFADGFQEEFAEFANTLYKKYIQTEPSVLFRVESSKRLEEIRSAYALPSSLSQMEQDALEVFSSMVRRFILVRLLDFGTEEEIQRLSIPATTCLFPFPLGEVGIVPQRRKSINVLAGSTIARKISRVFEPKSMLTKTHELEPTEITLAVEHKYFCLLFSLLKRTQMHSLIYDRLIEIPIEQTKIRVISFAMQLAKKDSNANALEGEGHAISLFRFQDLWYLQDDNIGIAIPLEQFQLDHFLQKKGEFFISSYKQLQNKSDLIEQGYFTEKELREGKGVKDCFYGYRYSTGTHMKEKILAKTSLNYFARYDSGFGYLFLCIGDISEAEKKKASAACETKTTAAPLTKESRKVKDLPESLIQQLNMPTTAKSASEKQLKPVRNLRKNILANFNSFTTTKKNTNKKSVVNNATRKVKPYKNPKILNQFTSF